LRKQRGFVAPLLGAAWSLFKEFAPFIAIGLGIALLSASIWGGIQAWERKKAEVKVARLVEEKAKLKGEYDAFVSTVRAAGEKAEREAAEQRQRNDQLYAETISNLRADIALRDGAIRRLRERAAARPDGSTVPTASQSPAGFSGPPGEYVPLEEYRALEARAYDDAFWREKMRAYLEGLVQAGVLVWEGQE
jgi:hypothetical protein